MIKPSCPRVRAAYAFFALVTPAIVGGCDAEAPLTPPETGDMPTPVEAAVSEEAAVLAALDDARVRIMPALDPEARAVLAEALDGLASALEAANGEAVVPRLVEARTALDASLRGHDGVAADLSAIGLVLDRVAAVPTVTAPKTALH